MYWAYNALENFLCKTFSQHKFSNLSLSDFCKKDYVFHVFKERRESQFITLQKKPVKDKLRQLESQFVYRTFNRLKFRDSRLI